ncbi:MAG TPA: PDDEXK nuclease domain-containing protein [Geobacteraceae bacterium]
MSLDLVHYTELLGQIKQRIRQGQTRAVMAANAEMIALYWDVGKLLHERQQQEGWGRAVIPRLARDIHNELPDVKGFSERNIGRMVAFYRAYSDDTVILPQSVAKLAEGDKAPQPVAQTATPAILQQLAAKIPWGHNILLMEKVKNLSARLWYMQQIVEHGYVRDTLLSMIIDRSYERHGKAVNNFDLHLPPAQSGLVKQALKDPYLFDFLTLEEPFHERELETELIRHLEKFLLELGQGFAFVGRQYRVEVGEEDYYIDLLFYHLKLRCYVVIELKKGSFKAEYAGKMNFYCNVVDDRLRHADDKPTIGLILCQDRKTVLAEYALRGIDKPIGISEYELTRALPESLKSALPSIEDIERELSGEGVS